MPRPAGKKAATKATTKVVTKTRSRRTPYDLIQDLKAKRDDLYERMTGQIAKLDERIAKLEEKHEHKIKVSELLHSKTPEELEREFEAMKKQQVLLRKALKQAKK